MKETVVEDRKSRFHQGIKLAFIICQLSVYKSWWSLYIRSFLKKKSAVIVIERFFGQKISCFFF